MEDQPLAIQAAPQHLPVSLDTAQLQKLAELRRAVPQFRRAVRAWALELALEEIDRAFAEALVVPLLAQGAPPEEVAVAVEQVAVVTEAVKRPLLRRFTDYLEEDARVRDARAERANRRTRTPAPPGEPVVTTVASAAGPIAAKPDRPILPLHAAR